MSSEAILVGSYDYRLVALSVFIAMIASYAALDGERRRQARLLTSLLRIAEKLESEHAQRISGVDVQISGRKAIFIIRALDGTRLDLLGLERKSGLFEKEFHLKPEFRRAQGKEKVA